MKPLETPRALRRAVETNTSPAAIPLRADETEQFDLPPIGSLPREHPAWHHDALTLSERAQSLFAKLAPVVLHVLGFGDHAIRSVQIGDQRLCIDASGSYRLQ